MSFSSFPSKNLIAINPVKLSKMKVLLQMPSFTEVENMHFVKTLSMRGGLEAPNFAGFLNSGIDVQLRSNPISEL